MKLVESSIRYPVTVLVGVLLAVLFGVIALTRIPLQMTPTVDRPVITVETNWRGASPREVEEEITDKLEEQLNHVEGVNEITSTSSDGQSKIQLTFDWGTNKDVARLEVSEKIGLVGDLPDEADEPVIKATSSDEENPIAWIVTDTEMPVNKLRIIGDDVIQPRLERVEGVGGVLMFGGEDREVHVLLNMDALVARRIGLDQVRRALAGENLNVKAGGLEEGKRRYVVRTVGQYETTEDVEKTVIGWQDGTPVYVRNVARVVPTYQDPFVSVRSNGEPTVVFGVLRKTGANSVEVMKRVGEVVDWVNRQYGDKGIRLEIVYSETGYIKDSVALVRNNLLYGAALAVVVLLLFLRSAVSTFIVAFSIPVSVVVTFIFLQVFDRTLNIISLAGLAFAVGMVVDNAIVVLENIFRHQEMGKTPFRAAYDGTVEVWGAVLSSTLTTLAVFIPILFIQQEAGQLFKDIAIALSCSIGMSLLVSITVIPMMSSRLLRVRKKRTGAGVARAGSFLVNGITGIVAWLIGSKFRKAFVSAAIVFLAVWTAWQTVPPLDYLPQGNRPIILTILLTPPGFNPEEMSEIVGQVEQRYLAMPEIDHMFAVTFPDDPIVGTVIKPEYADKVSMQAHTKALMGRAFGIAGVTFPVVFQVPLFTRAGDFASADLNVVVRGPDLETIEKIAARIEGGARRISEEGGFTSVRSSYDPGLPELRVKADREKAAAVGLTVSEVGQVVGTVIDGTLAGEFRERGREIDLVMRASGSRGRRTQDILGTALVTPTGDVIHLGDVASLEFTTGPAKIDHTDLDRSISIGVGVDPTEPLEEARRILEEKVVNPARADLPGLEYTIDLTGQARDLDVTWAAVSGSFVLAVIIVYLLMSALFESFVMPFVIILSVPMALTGGIFGVAVARAFDPTVKLDVITMLGFVILAGVVVNNAILIVHQSLNNIRTGMASGEALVESVRSRIRPIFMSTTTSIMGMLPLVLAGGAGTELYKGLGAVVVGGLALSTVFTLFLIPCLFGLSLDMRSWLTRTFGWKPLEQALRETRAFRAEA